MKIILSLLIIALFTPLSHADAILVFEIPTENESQREVNFKIRGNILRIDQADSTQYKLYDQLQQALFEVDARSGNITRIDEDDLRNRVAHLNQQRLTKLAEVEQTLKDKLQSKPIEEKRIAEVMINQLKYPEFYGAHTHLEVSKSEQKDNLNDIECQIYTISRNQKVLKQLCMARQKELGLSDGDYATLRDFYRFNYSMQSRLWIAAGKTDFVHVDYESKNIPGIPIRVQTISGKNKIPEIFLKRINHDSLEPKQFIVKTQ